MRLDELLLQLGRLDSFDCLFFLFLFLVGQLLLPCQLLDDRLTMQGLLSIPLLWEDTFQQDIAN